MSDTPFRLTALAHGGGCGCKLAPSVLTDILAGMPLAGPFPDLLVGAATSDDAAVWRLGPEQALVATTDFFMPIVDDPFDFGRIAATNALSDIWAMGASPIFALAIVGMPVGKMPLEAIRAILAGGAAVCAEAGVPIAGGHSIDSAEPIYGLAAIGLVHPEKLLRNDTARLGDVLILTKPLGVGVLSAALKQGRLPAGCYEALVATATQANAVGAEMGRIDGVHAMTDVTGFGLLGHALEMGRGAGVTIRLDAAAPRLLPGVEALARAGVRTGAAGRNWASYGEAVSLPPGFADWRRDLLTDPQTSGGLLVACAPHAAPQVLALVQERGFAAAARVGLVEAGPASVSIGPLP